MATPTDETTPKPDPAPEVIEAPRDEEKIIEAVEELTKIIEDEKTVEIPPIPVEKAKKISKKTAMIEAVQTKEGDNFQPITPLSKLTVMNFKMLESYFKNIVEIAEEEKEMRRQQIQTTFETPARKKAIKRATVQQSPLVVQQPTPQPQQVYNQVQQPIAPTIPTGPTSKPYFVF